MLFQRRTVLVLILVCLFVIFLNLKSEETDPSDKKLTVPERIVIALYSPVVRGFNIIAGGFKSGWRHYLDLVGTRKENEQLQDKLQWREAEIASLKERLQAAHDFTELKADAASLGRSGVWARVVAYDPLGGSQSVWINAGENAEIKLDQPVIAPAGLVGRVIKVTTDLSQVLLLPDPHFSVDVIDAETRVRALVVGTGRNRAELPHPPLMSHLEYLRLGSEIHQGDLLVTSGLGLLYPAGIPVGTVISLDQSGDGSFFSSSQILPAVDFGRLENVLVLTEVVKLPVLPGALPRESQGGKRP